MRSTSRWEFAAPLSPEIVRVPAGPSRRSPGLGSPDSASIARELARRYLSEGRLRVHMVGGSRVEATVDGIRAERRLGYDQDRGWWCSCDRGEHCAHLRALRLVTADPSGLHPSGGAMGALDGEV